MITLTDGRTLNGTPLQMVRSMRSLAPIAGEKSLGEYIDWVVDNALRFDGADLRVTGESEDERAKSLIEEMIRTGLAVRS